MLLTHFTNAFNCNVNFMNVHVLLHMTGRGSDSGIESSSRNSPDEANDPHHTSLPSPGHESSNNGKECLLCIPSMIYILC